MSGFSFAPLIRNPTYWNCWDVANTASGDFIVTGETYIDESSPWAFIARVDGSGDLRWCKTLPTDTAAVLYDVMELSTGDLVLVGYRLRVEKEACIIRTDSSGNVLWAPEWALCTPKLPYCAAYSVDTTADGGYFVAGQTCWDDGRMRDEFTKVLETGSTCCYYNFPLGNFVEYECAARSVHLTEDGGVIVVGHTDSYGNGDEVFAARLDASGDEIWERRMSGDRVFGLELAVDGGAMAVGYSTKLSGATKRPYFMKLSGPDADGDGVGDAVDNCPDTANSDQANADADSLGDVCDNCDSIPNPTQLNSDADTLGNACDNCVAVVNNDQLNSDTDSLGNACDNCENVPNNDQHDCDGDGIGDACNETCCLLMGDFTHDGAFNPLDAVAFVQWMWGTGAPPACLDEGDVNCNCIVDPLDAVYMTNHLWKGDPPPCPCENLVK